MPHRPRAARPALKALLYVVLACCAWSGLLMAVAAQGGNDITYVYDELGRLVGVIDPAGETVTYSYDAVGNLLSISRRSSAAVSIIEFTPDGGAAGTPVTIYGTGFSATAAENTVTFNGVAAAAVSSTNTRLAVAVPQGATTGPIVVTTPAGTAASTTPFSVDGLGSPTITGFTPQVGPVGTVVNLTGTNFENDATANRVRVNTSLSVVTSATATSLTAEVPKDSMAGRITVTTPSGTAVSSDDFFVTPAPYAAADVGFTGRMSVGQSKVVSVATANKIGLVAFDAAAGQRISLKATGVTISQSSLTIYRPDGAVLASGSASTSGGFIDALTLPTTGTYSILVDPSSTSTGSMTLTLYNVVDVTGAITPGGPSVTTVVNTPGQNIRLTFGGVAGQRISMQVSGNSFPFIPYVGPIYLPVRLPDGSTLTSVNVNGANPFLDALSLPVTGTYSIEYNPSGDATGRMTFTLYDVLPDVTGTITPGGPSVTVSNYVPGQNMLLTFEGAADQKISLKSTSLAGSATVSVKRPGGATLVSAGAGNFINPITLPVAGTYTIFIDPYSAAVGSTTLTLYDVADVTGTITPGGPAVTTTVSVPGQNVRLTFEGTAGRRISMQVSGNTFPFIPYVGPKYLPIKKPDGTTLASVNVNGSNPFLDVLTLPVTGTYAIEYDPADDATGSMTFTLYDVPPDVTGTITPGGPSVTATVSVPGQNILLTFDGAAGQKISLSKTGVGSVTLKKPDGAGLASGDFINAVSLPVAGTYTISVDPSGAAVGSATLTLYNVTDITGTITPGGPPVTADLNTPGQQMVLSFDGVAGQRVSLNITGGTFSYLSGQNVYVYVKKPDGTNLASADINGASQKFIDTLTLPVAGAYTIQCDPPGQRTGSATFTLYGVTDVAGTINVGGAAVPVTVTTPGQNASLTFEGTAGQQVTVRFSANTIGGVNVRLLKPDNTQLTSAGSSAGSFNLTTQTLPVGGTYTIVIDPGGAATGGVSVTLTNP